MLFRSIEILKYQENICPVLSFNLTKVELKFSSVNVESANHGTFNLTKVELKSGNELVTTARVVSFNLTKVELKYKKQVALD